MTYFTRTENGQAENVSSSDALETINWAMMGGSRDVAEMSAANGRYSIRYRNGDRVLFERQDGDMPQAQPVRTARIARTMNGDVMGRVVTAKGKDYVLTELVPADRPIHKGAPKGWKPTAYVTYWSVRNGERFGATRTAGPSAKPGTVGHVLFHNAMDHVNGTGA